MTPTQFQQAERGMDYALGSGAATLPLWAQSMEGWLMWGTAVAGALLVLLRLYLAVREWRQKKMDGNWKNGG